MSKKPQHQCTPACNKPGKGLAAHNRAVLASLNEDADIAEWAPQLKDAANGRKPWPPLERQWAEHGVTVEGPDEYGLYAYTDKDGGTMYTFSLSAPAKPRGPAAALPKLTAAGDPALFAGFKRSKVRELTRAELEAVCEDVWPLALEEGAPERISGLRHAVRLGATVYVFTPMECRQWRREELAAKEAPYQERHDDPFAAIPWHKPHEHSLPLASASVIVTDDAARAGTLYLETEQEQTDVFA
jgi:hypothetical protein